MKQPEPDDLNTLSLSGLLEVLIAFKKGNFTVRMPLDKNGITGKIADTLNEIIDTAEKMEKEFQGIGNVVGKDGKIAQRIPLEKFEGFWGKSVNSINTLLEDMAQPINEIGRVMNAVASGDLSQSMPIEVDGRPLRGDFRKTTIIVNTMVIQLSNFASEVTRVAHEVGTEGKLGGQAKAPGTAGIWKDLTDNVNQLASNLTTQVRNIVEITTAVANGDLSKKITVDVKGEVLELKKTINMMVDQLNGFASEVTRVAREVGTEGKLGGQAKAPGATGIWRDLTDNVNQLASNWTTQVRAIAEVATAVAKGDFTRSITVEAEGEVSALKANVNEMIQNLKETTRINTEQDWLKTNIAKFTRLLQGQRNLENVSKLILSELVQLVDAQHGTFYINDTKEPEPVLKLLASYAFQERKHLGNRFKPGEGLIGQCVIEKKRIATNAPGDYIKISSGLGEAPPLDIVVIPVIFEGEVKAVIELASFYRFTPIHLSFLDNAVESIGIVLNMIMTSMRTEELLIQSQRLTEELQGRQEELENTNRQLEEQAESLEASEELLQEQRKALQETNDELKEKANLLAIQNREVEEKNDEVEKARLSLEEKAKQLSLSSNYKSEFLANMSHELRTPLNSMLILSKLLSNNVDGNLIAKQIEFAKTIHSSGQDLLQLINNILDLSKIESGKMTVEILSQRFNDFASYMERTFREIAIHKNLDFFIEHEHKLPATIETDTQRLQQVIHNLLSNAFKFTEKGSVTLKIFLANNKEWTPTHPILSKAAQVVGFSVIDTGCGIPVDKQKIIFEAFMQADGSTRRKHGGTGLGLSISRELAHLLGGELKIESTLDQGSTFTLYLPIAYISTISQPESEKNKIDNVNVIIPPKIDTPIFSNMVKHPNRTDDRDKMGVDEKIILIIEDDEVFASYLYYLSHDNGYKVLIALNGEEGMLLIKQFKIQGIFLDIVLPDIEGWTILDFLKRTHDYQHIPVFIISVNNESQRSLRMGAKAHFNKPVDKEALVKAFDSLKSLNEHKKKKVLIVDNDDTSLKAIIDILEGSDIETRNIKIYPEALDILAKEDFDCMVLYLGNPDMFGINLLEQMHERCIDKIPVVVYIDREISKKEETHLKSLAKTMIIKNVQSPERLLDETSIFLHRLQDDIPEEKRKILTTLAPDPILKDKKVLIVDDDVRNIFAMISILERHQMQIFNAENGKDGIEQLQKLKDIDIILMDIMMPEMDGYEAMRQIRKIKRFSEIPIIAITAKAMKGDKEKCLMAGASDYVTKPIDINQLISTLRIWLNQ